MWAGTIYSDGRVRLDGYEPTKTRLVGINNRSIAIHHPGGRWWDNGGEHYTPAWISVHELESIKPANEPDTWRFEIKRRGGKEISFHPTPKVAARNAVLELQRKFGE